MLKDLQFQVILKTNATLDTMADAVFTFGEQLKGGGVGLFYYSGHGLQVKGENYLIPVDANIGREDDIKRKTINAREVLEKMDEAKSHLNLVFLDACRNNPFPRSVRAVSRGLAGMNAPTGTLLVFATNPDNVAADGEGRNGAYTKHLLQYIKQPGLEVGMMLRKIRTAVKEETGGQQVPWENGSIEGEFYFKGMSGAPPVTLPASSSPDAEPIHRQRRDISLLHDLRDRLQDVPKPRKRLTGLDMQLISPTRISKERQPIDPRFGACRVEVHDVYRGICDTSQRYTVLRLTIAPVQPLRRKHHPIIMMKEAGND